MARLPFCSWRRTPLNEITHTAYKEIALHLSWHEMSAEEAWYRVSSFIQCAKISVGLTCCASGTVAVKCPLETVFRSFFQPLLHLYRMLLAALPLFQSLLNSKETEMNVREKKKSFNRIDCCPIHKWKKIKKADRPLSSDTDAWHGPHRYMCQRTSEYCADRKSK